MRLLLFFVIAPLAAFAADINQLVVFGDSLSDNGNAAIAQGGTVPGNYAPNAYTDGPNTTPPTAGPFGLWVDQLAPKLGVSDPTPFLAGGTNYAVASALTGSNGLDGVSDQLNYFGASHLGGAPSDALYTFWAGANDIAAGSNPTTAADNIYANIQTIAAGGGKTFLWLNLPLLGETPNGAASGGAAFLNGASALFDTEWSIDLAKLQSQGINVIGVDVESLFGQILADPIAYGFTNVTDPAQNTAGNPNDYLFWDGEHPTTAGDALVADLAFADLTAPEPSSMAFALCGLLTLLFAMKSRSRGYLRSRN
jgi:outer membrane lipase/esterase